MLATTDPIATLLVGRGLGGRAFHAPLLGALAEFDLRTIAGSADALAGIAADGLELVVISTPNQTHFPLALAALEAGCHVVIDKPFTATLDEADALIALAAARGRMLSVFHNRRWDGDFLTVRRLLDEGAIGEPVLVEMHWDRFRPAIKPGWREVPAAGAGLLNDLGPHMIDQALQLFGMPRLINADACAQRDGAEVDDYFDLTLAYDGLRVRIAAATLIADPRPRFALHGTLGSFVKAGLDPQEEALKSGASPLGPSFFLDERPGFLFREGASKAVPTEPGRYLDYYRGVARAIRDGAPPPVDAADARAVQWLIAVARQSAADGRSISL